MVGVCLPTEISAETSASPGSKGDESDDGWMKGNYDYGLGCPKRVVFGSARDRRVAK